MDLSRRYRNSYRFAYSSDMPVYLTTSALVLMLLSTALPAIELQTLWSVKAQFEMPESAVIDLQRQYVYVSNVNEYALDNNGYVSRVSLDGKRVEKRWVTGLNSPTGMAIVGDSLFVADVDTLVCIDLKLGKISKRYLAPDAADFPVLNDVAISDQGLVFVSGSRSQSIYVLADNRLSLWMHDKDLLNNANGLFADGKRLIHGGTRWSSFDIASKKDVAFPAITPPLAEFDGISRLTQGLFLVTLVDDAKLWTIQENGTATVMSNKEWNGIDLHYHAKSGLLAMPQVGGHLSLFRILGNF